MGFKVMAERCNECLFSQSRIVSRARMGQILRDCRRRDAHFICHKATIAGNQNVCCRGFYDTQSTNFIRIAGRLGVIEFVTEAELQQLNEVGEGGWVGRA